MMARIPGFSSATTFMISVAVVAACAVSVSGAAPREPGKCSMYGVCDPTVDPTKNPVNCASFNVSAVQPNFTLPLCPELQSSPVCCSEAQYNTVAANLAQAEGLFHRCPACLDNFRQFWCAFTCSPNQSMFVDVEETIISKNTGLPVVTEVYARYGANFSWAFFNSCNQVKLGSSSTTVFSFAFDNPQSPSAFFDFMGQVPLNPFAIKFDVADEPVSPYVYDSAAESCASSCSCTDCPSKPLCNRQPGMCAMYDVCDHTVDPTKNPVNCASVNVSAVQPNFTLPLCPEFNSSAVCCSEAQYNTLAANLAQAQPLFARCPACLDNFRQFWCAFTCSPNQLMFVDVVSTNISKASGLPVVTAAAARYGANFSWAFFESCDHVKFGASGASVFEFVFDNPQSPRDLFNFMGQVPTSPFAIEFDVLDEPVPRYVYDSAAESCGTSCSCSDCPAASECVGTCSMYGVCDPNVDPSKNPVNCATQVRAQMPNFTLWDCPELNSSAVCCSEAQYNTLSAKLAQVEPLFARCPACMDNFRQFWCAMTCSPNQFTFVDVVSTAKSNNTGLQVVTEARARYSSDFARDFFNSCDQVKFGSSNDTVMEFLFGNPQSPIDFLNFMGKVPNSPFAIDFDVQKRPKSGDEYEGVAANCSSSCTCTDCPAVCPADLNDSDVISIASADGSLEEEEALLPSSPLQLERSRATLN